MHRVRSKDIMTERFEPMTANTPETEQAPQAIYVGPLKKLGIGRPDKGFPCDLRNASEQERAAYGQELLKALVPITDSMHFSCVDDRTRIANADGSVPEIRVRQASGTRMVTSVAMNSSSPLLREAAQQSSSESPTVAEIEDRMDALFEKITGVRKSAHLGGCAKVLGAPQDSKIMSETPAVFGVAKAIMDLPAVRDASGVEYSDQYAQEVRDNAAKTAAILEAANDGEDYVRRAQEQEPAGVEDLEVDHNDHEYHGHKINGLVFVVSEGEEMSISDQKMDEYGLGRVLVVSVVGGSVAMAKALAGNGGNEAVAKGLIANLAEHGALAHRALQEDTPVYILTV